MKSIYLGCPYSHKSYQMLTYRWRVVTDVAGQLMKAGHIVYSPITHSHPIGIALDNSLDHEFWEKQNKFFMDACDELWVLKLDGWLSSHGLLDEELYFLKQEKPVIYINPDEYGGGKCLKNH